MFKERSKWLFEYITPDLLLASSIKRLIASKKSAYQSAEILETGSYGRSLILDGKTQSTEADEFIYHESLVHPAMLLHPSPQSVFIAGGGEGATAREVLRHRSVKRVVMVDIDGEVVELCRKHLPNHHQGAFDDPRLELHIDDARLFLEKSRPVFNVIILDLPDPIEGGPAYLLYTRSFYDMVKSKLKPGGVMAVQSVAAGPTNFKEAFTPINHTLRSVFPKVSPYKIAVPSFGGEWAFNLASTGPDLSVLTPQEVDRRISSRLSTSLRFYDGVAHQGLFSLPKHIRKGLDEEKRVITEDKPLFVF